MTKTRSEINNAYAKKAYDSLRIIVPKGRKADVDAYAKSIGKSTNGLVNELLREALGIQPEEWTSDAKKAQAGAEK